jgi:hypothetical protein
MAKAPAVHQRIALAVALGVLFVLVGVVVVSRSSGADGGEETAAFPAECVTAWNHDEAARETGAHAATVHGYTHAWVTLISADGEPAADGGDCAVIFPAPQSDPEPQFAGIVLVGSRWRPLSRQPGIDGSRLADLQAEALESANANLFPDGGVYPR